MATINALNELEMVEVGKQAIRTALKKHGMKR